MTIVASENKIFETSSDVLQLNDPRIILLKTGKMTQLEFMRLIRYDDPFQIMNGKLTVITKEMQDAQKNGFLNSQKQMMLQTGGIQPSVLLDNLLFEEIYPEIKEDLTKVKNELDLATCKSCEKNRKLQPILIKLLAIKYDGRDLTELWKCTAGLNEMAMLKLKGELTKEYIDKVEIKVPMGIEKRHIDLIDAENEIDTSLIQNPLKLLRPDCADCYVKHMSTAAVILQEVITGGYTFLNGYYHEDLAAAELREAADELVKLDAEKAKLAINLEQRVQNLKNNIDKSLKLPIINDIYIILKTTRPGTPDNVFETIGLLNRLEQVLVTGFGDIKGSEQLRDIRLKFANQKEKAKTS